MPIDILKRHFIIFPMVFWYHYMVFWSLRQIEQKVSNDTIQPKSILSYGVYISRLIRFALVCSHVNDFNTRWNFVKKMWNNRLINYDSKICSLTKDRILVFYFVTMFLISTSSCSFLSRYLYIFFSKTTWQIKPNWCWSSNRPWAWK